VFLHGHIIQFNLLRFEILFSNNKSIGRKVGTSALSQLCSEQKETRKGIVRVT